MDMLEMRQILLNKHCSALQNPNKRQRKIALENIRKELFDSVLDERTVLVFFTSIQKYLVRCIHDESEACREYALYLIIEVVEKVPADEKILSFILPELRERMGSTEIKEPSEEVRLLIVVLLHKFVSLYGSKVAPYLDDYIEILKKTIVDPYPKVKQESCECAADMSKAIPRHFHLQSDSLIKPMVHAMKHQHYRVRVAVIKSLGDVICNGNNRAIDDVSTALAERLFDQNAVVRKTVGDVVGMWLLKLPDRYSYWHKLIPLILTCLTDEIQSQAEDAWKLWEAVGAQWVSENETDIKDKLDFLPEKVSWYPNGVRRPGIGCRELVQREMSKFIPGIVNELTDWKADIRVKSAQLLCVTIQHAEEKVTMHLSKLLPAMYKAFCDEDHRVVENIMRSAELIGYFVPAEVYCGQILPAIECGPSHGNLGVLACAVKYSAKDSVSPQIKAIFDTIYRDDIFYSFKVKDQQQLLALISTLMDNCAGGCVVVMEEIFNILVSVQSITESETLKYQAKDLLVKLCSFLPDVSNFEELTRRCTHNLLLKIQASVPQWTLLSPQLHVFQFILKEFEFGVAAELELILDMLKDAVEETMDAEVVLKLLWSLFDILQNDKLIAVLDDKCYFFKFILTQILPKQLVWKAGRSAEALRTASAACFNQGLYNLMTLTSVKMTYELFSLFFPLLLGLLEDSAVKTRLYSLESLQTLIKCAKSNGSLTVENINTLVPVVMKRLDDVSDSVRLVSLKVIKAIYKEPAIVCGDHIAGLLHNTLLLHLDDPNKDIQNAVLDTLKDVGKVNPEALLSKISIASFRDKDICSDLIDFLRTEISNTSN